MPSTKLDIEVTCPVAVALDCGFANGRSFTVAPGTTETFTQVTGDEYGYLAAQLEGARRSAKAAGALDSEVTGGGIRVLTKGYDVPLPGSKRHRKENPTEYVNVDGFAGLVHKSQVKAVEKAAKASK